MSDTHTKPETISEYIAAAPHAKARLEELYTCLRKAVPQAEAGLKWGNPAFTQKRVLFIFAAYKTYVTFYPTAAVMEVFKNEIKEYETTGGGIKFPLDKPIPTVLVQKLASYRLKEVIEKDVLWK